MKFVKRWFWGALLAVLLLLTACNQYPVEMLVFDRTELSLNIGEQYQLEVRVYPLSSALANRVSWSSSDESVAVVSADGTVTAVYSGQCTIQASAGGQTATCQVDVDKLDYEFQFNRAVALYYGDEASNGTSTFALRLLGDGVTVDNEGTLVGEGLFVNIEMYAPLSAVNVPAGNYEVADTHDEYTCAKGELVESAGVQYATGTFVGQRTAEGLGVVFVHSGAFWVTQTDDAYTLSAHFVGERDEEILLTFDGKIPMIDCSGETPRETYEFENEAITQSFLGAAEAVGLNQFAYETQSDVAALRFTLYAPLSVTDVCPNGLYDFAGARTFSIASATFVLNETEYAIAQGQVELTQDENADNQFVKCEFTDASGRIISGQFKIMR